MRGAVLALYSANLSIFVKLNWTNFHDRPTFLTRPYCCVKGREKKKQAEVYFRTFLFMIDWCYLYLIVENTQTNAQANWSHTESCLFRAEEWSPTSRWLTGTSLYEGAESCTHVAINSLFYYYYFSVLFRKLTCALNMCASAGGGLKTKVKKLIR